MGERKDINISDLDKIAANKDQTLESFINYCLANPSERFWQAMKNWAEVDYIYFGFTTNSHGGEAANLDGGMKVHLKDTYSFETKKN